VLEIIIKMNNEMKRIEKTSIKYEKVQQMFAE
jgi:hypothetical protein